MDEETIKQETARLESRMSMSTIVFFQVRCEVWPAIRTAGRCAVTSASGTRVQPHALLICSLIRSWCAN